MNEPVSAILDYKGTGVEITTADATVAEAVGAMNRARIGSLVVVDGERPVGIFTERDVLTRVVAEGRDPDSTRVAEVMTRELAVIGPATRVHQVMAIMTEKRYRHLPVVADGRLAGMISIGDVTRWSIKDQQNTIDDLLSYIAGEYPYPK
jgi:CBS domain-containing protein